MDTVSHNNFVTDSNSCIYTFWQWYNDVDALVLKWRLYLLEYLERKAWISLAMTWCTWLVGWRLSCQKYLLNVIRHVFFSFFLSFLLLHWLTVIFLWCWPLDVCVSIGFTYLCVWFNLPIRTVLLSILYIEFIRMIKHPSEKRPGIIYNKSAIRVLFLQVFCHFWQPIVKSYNNSTE